MSKVIYIAARYFGLFLLSLETASVVQHWGREVSFNLPVVIAISLRAQVLLLLLLRRWFRDHDQRLSRCSQHAVSRLCVV